MVRQRMRFNENHKFQSFSQKTREDEERKVHATSLHRIIWLSDLFKMNKQFGYLDDGDEMMFFNPRFVRSPATSELPSLEEFAGIYDFEMEIAQPTDNKRQTWQYSKALNKVFIIDGRSLPLMFRVSKNSPRGMYVRAVAVYTDPDWATKPVLRCPNHRQSVDDPVNKGYDHLDHVVSSNHQNAVYEIDTNSKRHSVAVRLYGPQAGCQWETIMYAMMCRSSCANGINRRAIAMVFTLELHYQVLGRRVLPVRVCASPYRDKNLEESKMMKQEIGEPLSPALSSVDNSLVEPHDTVYYVPVVHIDDYATLTRTALELVKAEYPPSALKDCEIDKYNAILMSLDQTQSIM